MQAFVGERQFPPITTSNKKDGRRLAAEAALQVLLGEGSFTVAQETPQVWSSAWHYSLSDCRNLIFFVCFCLRQAEVLSSRGLQPSFYDSIATLAHDKFVQLLATLPELLSGKKVLAAMIMKTSADDAGCVVSLGTGNRCITGELMSLEGLTVNDSHAEIITRRGLLRSAHLSFHLP